VLDGARLAGVIDESDVLMQLQGDPAHYGNTVSTAMSSALETLRPGSSIAALRQVLDRGLVAIVADGDTFHGLITRFDLLNHLRKARQ
jgi:cystathionine beta-synthase